jgi:hypothetical protein
MASPANDPGMGSLYRRLVISFRDRGLLRTAVHAVRKPFRRSPDVEVEEFGRRFGVQLSGRTRMPGEDVGYGPTSLRVFRRIMSQLPIDHSKFTFIDIGSGKGAVLLYAVAYPFRAVRGIELSPELHVVAEDNIRRYRNPERRCAVIESVCTDALTHPLSPDPTVFFLYNPFGKHTVRAWLDHVVASYETTPRQMYFVYYHSLHQEVFRHHPLVRTALTYRPKWWQTTETEYCIVEISPERLRR